LGYSSSDSDHGKFFAWGSVGSTSQRTQEKAIRIALGAKRGNIARVVLGSDVKSAAAGCILGMWDRSPNSA
jgi:hypothetical protein